MAPRNLRSLSLVAPVRGGSSGRFERRVDRVLQAALGTLDPRTLTPGDYRALHRALAAAGLLGHPALPGVLRCRTISASAVLARPTRPPGPASTVPCPPVPALRRVG